MGSGCCLIVPKPHSCKRLLVVGTCPTHSEAILGTACAFSYFKAAGVEGENRNQHCEMVASEGHTLLGTASNPLPAAQGSPKSIDSITNPPSATQCSREPCAQSSALSKALVLLMLLQLFVTHFHEIINEPRC